jgi:hypothetical protein
MPAFAYLVVGRFDDGLVFIDLSFQQKKKNRCVISSTLKATQISVERVHQWKESDIIATLRHGGPMRYPALHSIPF